MTITNGYLTLVEIKAWLDIPTATTTYDGMLEAMIEGISRAIDNYCNTRFFTSVSDETRTFTPISNRICFIDDLISITTLKTDDDYDGVFESLWTGNDYKLFPYNLTPKSSLETTSYGSFCFYAGLPNSVEVVGKFGYSSTTPPAIKQACYLWVSRNWKRKDSPLGIAGTNMFGDIKLLSVFDPDVKALLTPFVRIT